MSSWCSWNGKKWHFWDVLGILKGLHSVSAALSQSNAKALGADVGKMLHIHNLPQTDAKVLFLDKPKNWVRVAESSDEHTPWNPAFLFMNQLSHSSCQVCPRGEMSEMEKWIQAAKFSFSLLSFSGSVKVGGPQRCGWKKVSEQNRMTTWFFSRHGHKTSQTSVLWEVKIWMNSSQLV